jgi:hypothetical protein
MAGSAGWRGWLRRPGRRCAGRAAELDQPADPQGRIRQHEGPRRLCERDPGLLVALDGLVDDRLLICAGAGGSNGHRSGID